MLDVINKICVFLSWFFFGVGALGMIVFFGLYFMNDSVYLYFYFAIASFLLGVILFSIYRRVANLGMHKIIYSLNSVHQRVEEMNQKFQERHANDEPKDE